MFDWQSIAIAAIFGFAFSHPFLRPLRWNKPNINIKLNPTPNTRYVPSLINLVKQCGRGYAARAISYAGHGTPDDNADVEKWLTRKKERDTEIPFTVDGQILHKSCYMDMLDTDMKERAEVAGLSEARPPRYIFMAHSIGCHMIQRLLILRPDLLRRTNLILYVTPFHRMKSDRWSEFLLFHLSAMPQYVIGHAQFFMKLLSAFPVHGKSSDLFLGAWLLGGATLHFSFNKPEFFFLTPLLII